MAAKKFTHHQLLRLVENAPAYPAVLWPVPEGGYEVIFPNLPEVKSYGVVRDTAIKAGEEILTAIFMQYLLQGEDPPPPSDPQRLIPDEDEPPGTELLMLAPQKSILRRRLGLIKTEKGQAMKAWGIMGKK